MFCKLSVVVAIAALVNAAPKPVPHVLHEKREIATRDWVKGARIEKDAVIPMRIGLTQTNLDNGYDLLMDVSHPSSKNYGKHWTAQQVHDMFAPEEETVANVMNWLTDFGIHDGRIVHSENKGWIAVDVTVEEAEALLLTEFHEHEHAYSSKIRVGCDKYHVPEHIAPHIDFITPGIKLSQIVKRTVKRTPQKREENKLAKRATGSKKGGAALLGDAVKAAPAAITSPCGSNNCDRAFDQQYTASFSDLESFCGSWTSAPSDVFAATSTASWAANCVGTSTAAAQETAIASKISSACSCFVPATTTTSAAAGPTGCAKYVSVGCWRELYSIPTGTLHAPGLGIGLYEQGSYIVLEDIDLYWAKYAPEIPQGTYPINGSIDGGTYALLINSTAYNDIGEASLDLEITQSLIYPQNVTLYQVDDPYWAEEDLATTNIWNDFLDALDGSLCTYTAYGETGNSPTIDPIYPDTTHTDGYLGQLECGIYKPEPVISMSYGQAEFDLPVNYTKRTCLEFMKLGLQGVSIVASSGDFGVSSFPDDFFTEGITGCLGPEGLIFNPQFPSTCPYITSVGGTQIQGTQILPDGTEPGPYGTVYDPETVMIDNLGNGNVNFSSSGGFSNYFPRPSYQDGHVEDFFHQASTQADYPYYTGLEVNFTTTAGIYSRNGRAYPDVAANGAWMPLFINGIDSAANGNAYFGTSLAAPIFASVLALINEELAAAGKPTVGFVNPVLYSNDGVLNDITQGHNLGCGTEGFNAISGWDPATGLGTPNYPKMLELFMSL